MSSWESFEEDPSHSADAEPTLADLGLIAESFEGLGPDGLRRLIKGVMTAYASDQLVDGVTGPESSLPELNNIGTHFLRMSDQELTDRVSTEAGDGYGIGQRLLEQAVQVERMRARTVDRLVEVSAGTLDMLAEPAQYSGPERISMVWITERNPGLRAVSSSIWMADFEHGEAVSGLDLSSTPMVINNSSAPADLKSMSDVIRQDEDVVLPASVLVDSGGRVGLYKNYGPGFALEEVKALGQVDSDMYGWYQFRDFRATNDPKNTTPGVVCYSPQFSEGVTDISGIAGSRLVSCLDSNHLQDEIKVVHDDGSKQLTFAIEDVLTPTGKFGTNHTREAVARMFANEQFLSSLAVINNQPTAFLLRDTRGGFIVTPYTDVIATADAPVSGNE